MQELITQFLEALYEASIVTTEKNIDPDIWAWSSSIPTNGSFMLNNKQTYNLLLVGSNKWKTLKERWGKGDFEQTWAMRWKKLREHTLLEKQSSSSSASSWTTPTTWLVLTRSVMETAFAHFALANRKPMTTYSLGVKNHNEHGPP